MSSAQFPTDRWVLICFFILASFLLGCGNTSEVPRSAVRSPPANSKSTKAFPNEVGIVYIGYDRTTQRLELVLENRSSELVTLIGLKSNGVEVKTWTASSIDIDSQCHELVKATMVLETPRNAEIVVHLEARGERFTISQSLHDARALLQDCRFNARTQQVRLIGQSTSVAQDCSSVTLRLNGLAVERFKYSKVRATRNHSHHIWEISVPLQCRGKHLYVEALRSGQLVFAGFLKPAAIVFFGPNQYHFPLRITEVSSDANSVRIGLYNESNSKKPALELIALRVDGADHSDLIANVGILPADRQQFRKDTREFVVPRELLREEGSDCEIDYCLAEKQKMSDRAHRSVRTLQVRIRPELCRVIGGASSSTLRNTVCLHHGGLRPISDNESVAKLSRKLSVSQSLPTYVRCSESVPTEDISGAIWAGDFGVLSPSLPHNPSVTELSALFEDCTKKIRQAGQKFVMSLTKATSQNGTSDVKWCVLMALAHGSKGLLLDGEAVVGQRLGVGQSALGDPKLSELIGLSVPIELPIVVNQDGICVRTVLLDDKTCLVFVVNLWCTTNLQPRITQSFTAIPRHHVCLALSPPLGWENLSVMDLSTQTNCDIAENNGFYIVDLPEFMIGRVFVMSSGGRHPLIPPTAKYFADIPVPECDVYPLSPWRPTIGSVSPGESVQMDLRLRNRGTKGATIVASTPSSRIASKVEIDCAPTIIPAATDGVLSFTMNLRRTFTRTAIPINVMQVHDDKSSSRLFSFFISASARLRGNAEPPVLDFGEFNRGDAATRLLKLTIDDEVAKVHRVTVRGAPLQITKNPDLTLSIVPNTQKNGKFSGSITAHMTDEVKVSVPYSGYFRKLDLVATPNQLQLFGAKSSIHNRTVHIRSASGSPFKLIGAKSNVDWIKVSFTNGIQNRHSIVTTIIAPNGTAEGQLELRARLESGIEQELSIPLRMVTDRRKPSESGLSSLESVRLRVKNLLQQFRRIPSPASGEDCWLGMHSLLFSPTTDELSEDRIALISSLTGKGNVRSAFTLRRGRPYPRKSGNRFDTEHHRDQFLHVFSLVGVDLGQVIKIKEHHYSVDELLSRSKFDVRASGELSWTVSAYSHYLTPGKKWTNKFGETLSFEMLLGALYRGKDETCGGSHRYFGLARSVKAYPLSGFQKDINTQLSEEAVRLKLTAFSDGTFRLPARSHDEGLDAQYSDDMVLQYTGHTIEWLGVYLSSDELKEDWVVSAVDSLAKLCEQNFLNFKPTAATEAEALRYGFAAHAAAGLTRWLERTGTNSTVRD